MFWVTSSDLTLGGMKIPLSRGVRGGPARRTDAVKEGRWTLSHGLGSNYLHP